MSNCKKTSTQAINCFQPTCPKDQLICINCCVPISATCQEPTSSFCLAPATVSQTLFQTVNSSCEKFAGFVDIEGEICSSDCLLVVLITERDQPQVPLYATNGCLTIPVSDLISVTIGAITFNPDLVGTIVSAEASLQLRKIVELKC